MMVWEQVTVKDGLENQASKNLIYRVKAAWEKKCGHDVKVVFKSETNISSDSANKENLDELIVNHKTKSFKDVA